MSDNAENARMVLDWLPYPQVKPEPNELVLAAAQYMATAGPNTGKPVTIYLVCLYVEADTSDGGKRFVFVDGAQWKWGRKGLIQYFEPITYWARIPAPPIPDPVPKGTTGLARRPHL